MHDVQCMMIMMHRWHNKLNYYYKKNSKTLKILQVCKLYLMGQYFMYSSI